MKAFARVLLVDGVDAMRHFHRHQLRNAGFHNVFETRTSHDALLEMKRQTFDLIVWSVARDALFGELLNDAVSRRDRRIPILVFSQHGDTGYAAAPNQDYLVLERPVTIEGLRHATASLSQNHGRAFAKHRQNTALSVAEAHRPTTKPLR